MTSTTTLPSAPIRPDWDADLVAKLRRQAPGAVETLVARYGALLYRLAVGITGNEEDAEEVVQDALCAAVYRIESFRHESTFGSWLYRIAANAAYGARRRRRHACQHVSWDEVIAALVASLAGVTGAQPKRRARVGSGPAAARPRPPAVGPKARDQEAGAGPPAAGLGAFQQRLDNMSRPPRSLERPLTCPRGVLVCD